MIYMKFNLCNTVHNKMASVQYNNKNDILGLLLVIIWVAHIFWMPSAEFKWAI